MLPHSPSFVSDYDNSANEDEDNPANENAEVHAQTEISQESHAEHMQMPAQGVYAYLFVVMMCFTVCVLCCYTRILAVFMVMCRLFL